MKFNKIIFIGCFISVLLLGSIVSSTSTPNKTKISLNHNNIKTQEVIKTSQFANRRIRIAIYNEPNLTLPAYVSINEYLHNSYSDIRALLESMGHQVSELTRNDIYSHKLKTAYYDVFLMVDNIPKVNITNQVKEFWLGGGGILSFGGAINYLCYAGILPPESEGDDGHTNYWDYTYATQTQNITTRHPITKSYQVNDKFTATSGTLSARNYFIWDKMQTTTVASEITKLANEEGYNNIATVVAFDPIKKGGRVVQMPGDGDPLYSNMNNLIIDAVDWLCPRPKGRVLFDLSHEPNCGIDPWDSIYVQSTISYYSLLRNNLINRSYTFDKLYPSSYGNLTNTNLAEYDLLIETYPDINFTTSEVSTISNWISSGGALLAIGDRFYLDPSKNINYLLSNLELSIKDGTGDSTIDYSVEHPTIENCVELIAFSPGLIDYSGNAYPIWGSDASNINIAAQEYGNGRIILIADTAILRDSHINSEDNLQYGINAVNWLIACQAEVLVYVDENPSFNDPNDNPYKGPVATALNDLCIGFYLTFNKTNYFNLSLVENDWQLIIIDSVYRSPVASGYDDELLNYVKNGGKLIIRDPRMYSTTTSPLWQYLGFTPNSTRITNPPPIIYLWNSAHSIFKTPAYYNANNLTTSLNPYATDFCYVKLYSNSTAIAGIGSTQHNERGAIILSSNGRFIANTMALTEYYDDTDDSTYPDALEIWENEIAYLMPSSAIYPSGGGDDDDDDGGKVISNLLWLIILIIAIVGIVAFVAIVYFLKKKR